MSNEIEMKRLADVEAVETVSDEASVLIVQDGEVKQTAKSNVGGGGFMRIDISVNEDESEFYANVSGVAITEALNNGIMPYCVIAGMVCPLMQSPALSPASVMAAAPKHTFSSIQINGTGNSFVLKCEIDIAEPDVPCRVNATQYSIASDVLKLVT